MEQRGQAENFPLLDRSLVRFLLRQGVVDLEGQIGNVARVLRIRIEKRSPKLQAPEGGFFDLIATGKVCPPNRPKRILPYHLVAISLNSAIALLDRKSTRLN